MPLDIFDNSIILEISNRPGHQNCVNRTEPIPGINGFTDMERRLCKCLEDRDPPVAVLQATGLRPPVIRSRTIFMMSARFRRSRKRQCLHHSAAAIQRLLPKSKQEKLCSTLAPGVESMSCFPPDASAQPA